MCYADFILRKWSTSRGKVMSSSWLDSRAALQLWQCGRGAIQLPDSWPEPRGWQLNTVDPMKLLACYKHLSLRDGYVLRSLLFGAENSRGLVRAYPSAVPQSQPSDEYSSEFNPPPAERGVIDDFMTIVELDGSPSSYLEASWFYRNAQEIGASWHGLDWSTHSLLLVDPRKNPSADLADELSDVSFELVGPRKRLPSVWRPRIELGEHQITVNFFTYSGLGQGRIIKHVDVYEPGKAVAATEEHVLAHTNSGYVF